MYKQKFYSALKDIFVGEEIEGESGFVNLMKIKSSYYDKIENKLRNKIDELVSNENEEMEIYEKLYTFFESYLNETGTPFFNSTQIHKNIYEKIYSDKDDVSLFWKTKDLYYIKSEHNYSSMEIEKDGFTFSFDPSELEHKQNNTKENIEFYLVEADKENKLLKFKIKYQQNNDYTRLKEIFKINDNRKLQDFLIEDFDNPEDYPEIRLIRNDLDIMNDNLTKTLRRKMLDIRPKDDTVTEQIIIEFAAQGIDDIFEYLKRMEFKISKDTLKEVFSLYKRQNEIDYFIHKNPEHFLKEQFKIYLFNYVYENNISFEGEGLKRAAQLNKLKEIGFEVIKYIARFENELKAIWEKPKFVLNSEYVVTLDRLDINLIKDVINSNNIEKQIEEWENLGIVGKDFNIKDIFFGEVLNPYYSTLPIDTKHFPDLKYKILDNFEDIEENLDGWVINSDNYQALNTILTKYKNKVMTIYIDPPFNTGKEKYFSYIDKFQNSTWLTLMENRLNLVEDFLHEKGSFYLHLDENAKHLGRVLLSKFKFDQINDIIFDTNATKDEEADIYSYKSFGNKFVKKHSTIFYCRYNSSHFNKLWKPNRRTTNLDIGWLDLISKPKNDKPHGIDDYNFFIEQYNANRELEYKQINIDEKIYPIGDIWNDIYSFTQSEMRVSENLSFLTQKPENLLRRIIQTSSNKGDIVLDFFAGSGTTIATAHKLSRKWIGVEIGDYFNEFYYNDDGEKRLGILGRMKNVLHGDKQFSAVVKDRKSYLSKDINWQGGGFFKYYKLEQYEDVLRKAKYKEIDGNLEYYSFMANEKMLDALELDFKDENIKIKFENLYPDVDIAETLSNLLGKKIKKLNDKRVIFEDGMEIKFDEMTFEKYPFVKSLIWWGENKEDV